MQLANLCRSASANGTQSEHMQIAQSVREIINEQLPTVARAMWE